MEAVGNALAEHESGLVPGQVLEREREQSIETLSSLITGTAATLAVTKGYSDVEAKNRLAGDIKRLLGHHIRNRSDQFERQLARARERYHFFAAGCR